MAFERYEAFAARDEAVDMFSAEVAKSAVSAHLTSVEKGFWPDVEDRTPETYIAKMMLLTSEVAEVMEAYRKNKGAQEIAEEFADIYIRWIDLYAGMAEAGLLDDGLGFSIDIGKVIKEKMTKNAGRPAKHGNLL